MARLTKRTVDALKVEPGCAVIVWDTDVKGLGISVSRGGVKSFLLNYRGAGGRERRYTIGRFGEWTVENAREEARQLKAAVGRGEDPLSQRQARRQAPDTAPTVANLAAASSLSTTPRNPPARAATPRFSSSFTSFRSSARGPSRA
jgi:Arm domain-containing DNA-binding protein